MKRILPYLVFSLLVVEPAFANNDGNVIGTEPVVLPDWSAKVYPNPNNGEFNIMVNGSSASLDVLIFNVIGEKVFETKILGDHGAKIDLQGLKEGIYVVQVIDESRGEVRTMRMQVR